MEQCAEMPGFKWQKDERQLGSKEVLERLAELKASAQADAKFSKDLAASGKLEGSYKSKLAETINLYVKQDSQVSDEFWEQDLHFRQVGCFFLAVSKQPHLDQEDKKKFLDGILEVNRTRTDYMYGVNKKKLA